MKRKITRPPTHPGELLKHEFLIPMGLTQKELAAHWGVDFKVINRLCNGHTNIDTRMAHRLAATFETSVDMWLNLQRAVDEWQLKVSSFKPPKSLVH